MPARVGPSHYTYFAMLHRRRIWFAHLAKAFEPFAASLSAWREKKHRLDLKHIHAFKTLSSAPHLGIRYGLPLLEVLDDTPVESFLTRTARELYEYELQLLGLMSECAAHTAHASKTGDADWQRELEVTSKLWGRELAQECLMTPSTKVVSGSLRGIYELYQLVLEGGDFGWSPLLLRRYTDEELDYEVRHCPHHRADTDSHSGTAKEVFDLLCKLEGVVYRSFVQALLPEVRFKRHHKASHCIDELRIDRQ